MTSSSSPSLKQRLRAGDQVVGAFVRTPADDIVEMLGVAGVDFILIDSEHGPAEVSVLRHHIALAQLHGMAALVRIGTGDHTLAQRALDQGAEGIVAPHIDTREQADALVQSVHYPPLGKRGFATYTRLGAFGTVPAAEHQRRAEDTTLVVAMIESPEAVLNAADILSTPGLDGYLVGTADLAASSGPGDPAVADALRAVRGAGVDAGAYRADLAGDVESAAASFTDGARLVVYNLTHLMMGLFCRLNVAAGRDVGRTES